MPADEVETQAELDVYATELAAWVTAHCEAIRPKAALRYSRLLVQHNMVTMARVWRRLQADKALLLDIGIDQYDAEELAAALRADMNADAAPAAAKADAADPPPPADDKPAAAQALAPAGGWVAHEDANSGLRFYHNDATGETRNCGYYTMQA